MFKNEHQVVKTDNLIYIHGTLSIDNQYLKDWHFLRHPVFTSCTTMIRSQLKIAFRNFRKNITHSLLNLIGLTLGLTACFFIAIYVRDEYSYDRWVPQHEQVYRIGMDVKTQTNDNIRFAATSGNLARALMEYPQVNNTVRVFNYGNNGVISTSLQKQIPEQSIFFADSSFFEVLPYPLLAGDSRTALNDADGIVLTAEKAVKYFGYQSNASNWLNHSLDINGTHYRVTGVLKDIPFNTYFRPDFIISTVSVAHQQWFQQNTDNWHGTMVQTFIRLKPNVSVAAFEPQIRFIAYKYVGDEIKANGQVYTHFMQPLASIHLHSNLRYELSKNGDALYIRILSFIALFILLIAGINFVNLATARATTRAKEVGVRKVIGAQRGQLIFQFMLESCMMSSLAFIASLLLMLILLPAFNHVADKNFTLAALLAPGIIGAGLGISLIIGLLSGIYPAIILSGFSPSRIIQRYAWQRKANVLRNTLVVTQFSISILLIIATIVVYKQLQFMKHQDLGFNQSQVLVIPTAGNEARKQLPALAEKLRGQADVLSVSASSSIPGRDFGNNLLQLKNDHTKKTDTRLLTADDQFFRTYDIKLLAGRLCNMEVDTTGHPDIMINESALPFFGWRKPEEALGQEFDWGWGRICGVYKDFHFSSLQHGVTPMAIFYRPWSLAYISVKMDTRNAVATIAGIEKTWHTLIPGALFSYFFLDEDYNKQYLAEQRLGELFMIFSVLAIVIASLGLFGLASFTIEQRTKEIGIRKVLGASISGIVRLMSTDFLRLVIIAAAIAFPLAWWAMKSWLQDFAYRVPLNAWIFIIAGTGALLIAAVIVSAQAVKAALNNPVNSLRAE
ncbi:FtsX-like permease family protein [Chitinophaga polysaccharea]|uniref:FtsX-like permease family protein n=1 Tax=Chitinophaga polysaccharea TaxID=1293035 RepID=UPI0014556F28|nr:FtsX-like permease family protein [Chitinophaga polysaccharea]NLR57886.1 FtsX-like permease family protein [Chitinophaga polysaccharea]